MSLPISTFHYLNSSFLVQTFLVNFPFGFTWIIKKFYFQIQVFCRLLVDLLGNVSNNQILCNNFTDAGVTVSEKVLDTKLLGVITELSVLLYWHRWWVINTPAFRGCQQFNFRVKTSKNRALHDLNRNVLFIRNCDSWNYLPI